MCVQFKQGQEVGHMKMKVAEAKGVGYEQVTLLLDGQPMFDPMSLCDYPTIKASNTATVEVLTNGFLVSGLIAGFNL